MSWAGGPSGLGGGGTHDSTPHNSTQGWAEQQLAIHWLPLYGTYKYNSTFNGLDGTCCTMASMSRTRINNKYKVVKHCRVKGNVVK